MSFSADMTKLLRKTGKTLDETVRGVKMDLFNGIIRDTRVDTGRLRGNWQTTTGRPTYLKTERKNKIPQYEDGGSAQDEATATVKSNTVDYMTNNLPYAVVYEEKDAIVAGNMQRVNRYVKKAIAEAKR